MSDTKPYQAAAERLMPLLNERIVVYDFEGPHLMRSCTELIRSAIAAEVNAERKAIAVGLYEKARVWGDNSPGCHYYLAADRIESRIGAPSALEAMIEAARQAERAKIDAHTQDTLAAIPEVVSRVGEILI